MDRIELYGHITDTGEVIIHNRRVMEQWAQDYKGKKIKIRVERAGSKRSDQQNKYYHAVVVEEVRLGLFNLGHQMNHDEVHYFLKFKFNPVVIPGEDGLAVEVPESTTTLTKMGMSEYIEKIAQWASEYLGIVIPPATTDLQLNL